MTISLSNRSVALLTALVAVAVLLPAHMTEAAVERDGRMYAARYISPSGSNGTGDGTVGNPWATFQYAIDLLSHDDTVFALPGTYGGIGNRNISTDGKRLLIKGVDGPLLTTIDAESEAYGFQVTSGGLICTIEGLRIIHAATGIYAQMAQVAVRDCHLDACLTGIRLDSGEVRYCEVVANTFYGVFVPSTANEVDIIGCRVDSNGMGAASYGVCSMAMTPSMVRLDSCDLAYNHYAVGGAVDVHNSTLHDGNGGAYGDFSGGGTEFRNCTFYGLNDTAVIASSHTSLTNCTLRNNSGMIAYAGLDNWLVLDSCDIYDNTGEAVVGYFNGGLSPRVEMSYCSYHSNTRGIQYLGVGSVSGSGGFYADHCTVANIANYGFNLWTTSGSGTDISVTNCNIVFNLGWGISCEIDNNIVCNNSAGNGNGDYSPNYEGTDGNISYDPLFCDTSGGDYSISSASPCAPANNGCGVLMGCDSVGCELAAGAIEIIRPLKEEPVLVESEYPIQWVRGADISSVNVDLSMDYGFSWQRISSGNTGTNFTWTVVDSQVGDDTRVRVLNASKGLGGDTTSGSFPVDPNPIPDSDDSIRAPSDSTGSIQPGEFDDITKGGDEITDIGFAYYDGTVEIYYGEPGGGFDTIPAVALNADPGIVTWTTADMNNDGSLDIILGNEISETVEVYLSDQSGSFSMAPPSEEMVRGYPVDPIMVGVADFNRDGHQDIWVISESASQLQILVNDGGGGLSLAHSVTTPYPPTAAATGDFGNDGIIDIAVSCGPSGAVLVSENPGDGDMVWSGVAWVFVGSSDMVVHDFDDDGWSDIGVVSSYPTIAAFTILVNDGDYGFAVDMYEYGSSSGGQAVVCDMTGDGIADVVVTCGDNDEMAIFPGFPPDSMHMEERPLIGYPLYVEPGDDPRYVLVGDFSDDGKPDLLTVNIGDLNTVMFPGTTEPDVPLDLTLTYPNGGEEFDADSPVAITWDKGEGIIAVDLEVSRDSGATWQVIVQNVIGYSYDWLVSGPSTTSAYIRVSDATVSSRNDKSNAVFTIYPSFGFASFEVVANASGELESPRPGALASAGFPTPGGLDPGPAQQVGAGKWAFHTADNGGSSGGGTRPDFEAFLERVLRGDNARDVSQNDFEMRFTGIMAGVGGSYAIATYHDESPIWVPFELWRIGQCTEGDPSDDVRMTPWILEWVDNYEYDLENWGTAADGGGGYEHSASPGDNDPYTDWIYWILPADSSAGESGYLADEAAILAGTYDYAGEEVIARTVLINVNGGITPPFNQNLPEFGTVFRITTTKEFDCGCCEIRGDITHDGTWPDIVDLVYLVIYMFQNGPPPPCETPDPPACPDFYYAEADINGDGGCVPDIVDLIHLVTYMFQGGPPPVPCP